MKDLNQIKNHLHREMTKLDDQVKNIRQIDYDENESKRATLQKMVHKFRYEISEHKAEVDDYIKVNLPQARQRLKERTLFVLMQIKKGTEQLIKAVKERKKQLKSKVKPYLKLFKMHSKAIRKGHVKYRKCLRNRNWRKRLRRGNPEQRIDRNISLVLGIVALTIIELLLLLFQQYAPNKAIDVLVIVFGVTLGAMFLVVILLALVPQMYRALVRREVKLLENARKKMELKGLTPEGIKRRGQKIKNEIVNVELDLERD